MRPFFVYYGAKWRAAHRYPAPAYDHVIEPFAGAAGYSVRHAAPRVTLYDLSPQVIGTWRYLIGSSPRDILALPDIPEGGTVDDLDICQEARWLVGWWLNKGVSAPRKTPSAWMRSGIRPASFWSPEVRAIIASQVGRISHWTAHLADYREAPDVAATWFVDPPYASTAGRHYVADRVDFEALGDWCRERAGQTIVCEAEGASWLPFEPLGTFKANSGRQKQSAVTREAIWLNHTAEQIA